MKSLFLVILMIFSFNGCSLIVHQYNSNSISIDSYNVKKLPKSIEIGTFKYIPTEKMEQNEFQILGLFSNENRKINTNISKIVENEIRKFSSIYIVNHNNKKCLLNGEIYNLSWNAINGDTTSTINYVLNKKDVIIKKTEITYIWRQGLFTIRSIPQKLSSSIHGNFNELLSNSNFLESINKNCK